MKVPIFLAVGALVLAVPQVAQAQWSGDRSGREELSYQAFFPTGPLRSYFGDGPHSGFAWTHRLTQPPSLGLGRTLFVDYATTGGSNSRNFLTGGLGLQSALKLGTEGTTLNLGAGLGYYGTFVSNGVFDPGKQEGALVRLTAGLQVTGNVIVEGAYYRALREHNGLEGVGLRLGVRF